MSDTREEVIQRLQNLLEQNALVTIIERQNAEGTTIRAGDIEFTIPKTPPSTISRNITRIR